MTLWLERKEQITRHASHVAWRLTTGHGDVQSHQTTTLIFNRFVKMPKYPSVSSVLLETLVNEYGAMYLCEALSRFIVTTNHPDWTPREVEEITLDTFLPFCKLPVFHKVKFVSKMDQEMVIVDSTYANCAHKRHGKSML